MSITWDKQEKPGVLPPSSGWDYDENLLEYDQDIDTESGLEVFYDGVGINTTWVNEDESEQEL